MLLGMFIMFVAMSGALGIAGWLAWRRLAEHLKDNPEAVAAVAKHVFVPLLSEKEKEGKPEGEPKPE